jgi:hypothetical protein
MINAIEYDKKVCRMLEKMPIGATVRIDRVCRPENKDRFVASIKMWIQRQPAGCGVTFSSDWTKYTKRADTIESDPPQSFFKEQNEQLMITAKKMIEWWAERVKRPIPPFTFNDCERFNDPIRSINGFIVRVQSSKPSSRTFTAYLYKLEMLRELVQGIDSDETE